ncbi:MULTISPECIES: hypothetical protein [unclassified Nocardioides]|uniref:hypothetical protein n=1 Tax=unclassified Nocardioides TaxID=2615069 RepID=UPI0006F2DAA3|nr:MULTISPECIES: hypothetical protein [unclassified Nocardioides]KRA37600.1 hypothetical protein ASD81_02520 [Nocardioides sp. Root614]KRA91561.1 hypothetical protein ASD84_02785 [Nocardioides sp. Root682]
MSSILDALTCLAIGCFLFPLGAWGRSHVNTLVVDAIQGEERAQRIAVLRRGATTCQVVAGVFVAVAFFLLSTR